MKKFKNDLAEVWFEDGILFLKFQKDTILDFETMKQTIALRDKFTVDENKYVLVDISNLKSLNNEARLYGSINGHKLMYACAVLVNSYFTKFLFMSYIKFSKPNVPFVFFTSKEKAIEWLNELKSQYLLRQST